MHITINRFECVNLSFHGGLKLCFINGWMILSTIFTYEINRKSKLFDFFGMVKNITIFLTGVSTENV